MEKGIFNSYNQFTSGIFLFIFIPHFQIQERSKKEKKVWAGLAGFLIGFTYNMDRSDPLIAVEVEPSTRCGHTLNMPCVGLKLDLCCSLNLIIVYRHRHGSNLII